MSNVSNNRSRRSSRAANRRQPQETSSQKSGLPTWLKLLFFGVGVYAVVYVVMALDVIPTAQAEEAVSFDTTTAEVTSEAETEPEAEKPGFWDRITAGVVKQIDENVEARIAEVERREAEVEAMREQAMDLVADAQTERELTKAERASVNAVAVALTQCAKTALQEVNQ